MKPYFGTVNEVGTYGSERTHREADRVLLDRKQSLSATVAPMAIVVSAKQKIKLSTRKLKLFDLPCLRTGFLPVTSEAALYLSGLKRLQQFFWGPYGSPGNLLIAHFIL